MRVVGYIRELPADANPAFSQGEAIRRWASRGGHQLVATFQDGPGDRNGYQAMLGVLQSNNADGLVVAGIGSLSADLITQEVMIWHIRSLGVALTSTETEEASILAHDSDDQTRNLVRHVLAKREGHDQLIDSVGGTVDLDSEEDGVLIEFVESPSIRAS